MERLKAMWRASKAKRLMRDEERFLNLYAATRFGGDTERAREYLNYRKRWPYNETTTP